MTSTSSEQVVLRGLPEDQVVSGVPAGDLRAGTWTRLGGAGVLGDPVTEAALDTLAERARAAGHAQGYAAGWAEGMRRTADAARDAATEHAAAVEATRAAMAAQQAGLVDALGSAADSYGRAVRDRYGELADQALDLALRIAEAVLDRELAVAADPGRDALSRALRQVEVTVPVTVRLHPDDVAALDPTAVAGHDVTVVGDPALGRGDAVAETDSTVVDATVASALARVREVLGR